ncbi:MAG: DNA polymerase I [Alphaproteobacteria bacterium]|nr:MAG: DNA polymerase I [Alphaproteobacteria bacterium]TAF16009.1 MAG: DNA polymerase I [Alphaproteobacteria bacterium]TAF76218.1 MAG: DNA polymerase I [Alphaproteobacteria bacterium]
MNNNQKNAHRSKLVVIDGSGFIFRAYHRLPPLSRKDGTPIGAVYGCTTMLLKLREELQATHCAVVFDAGGKNFRHDLYEEYKAHRPPLPEDLIPQFPIIRDAVRALNLAVVEQTGYEADDILASYAQLAKARDMDICIVTSDKDMMQLIAEGVMIYDPMKHALVREEDVIAKFGVPPHQVIEVQALMGDATDNIPGIKGIGVKTAAELILHYGTLENLLAHTHEIPQAKRRALLEDGAPMALLSKQLVTLCRECSDLPAIDDLIVRPLDKPMFAAFCAEQGFAALLQRIGGTPAAVSTPVPMVQPPASLCYQSIEERAALDALIARIKHKGSVAVHLVMESTSALKQPWLGIALALKEGEAYYVPFLHDAAPITRDLFAPAPIASEQKGMCFAEVFPMLLELLQDDAILKIGFDVTQTLTQLLVHGLCGRPWKDAMLLSYCLRAGDATHTLDALSLEHLGCALPSEKSWRGTGKNLVPLQDVSRETLTEVMCQKVDMILRLANMFHAGVIKEQRISVYELMERPLIPIIAQMQATGIKVDKKKLAQLSELYAQRLNEYEAEIYQLAGHEFNIGSPKQLGIILFDELQLAKGKKSSKSKEYVTDAETLEELAAQGHLLPQRVLQWRQCAKLKSTYTDALQKQIDPITGRVHTRYALASTSTGRLSSSDPNLQNIPIRTQEGREIRTAFIAEAGYQLLCADYSQIELRLLAHCSGSEALIEAFRRGKDIHTITAMQMFGIDEDQVDIEMRRKAKTINFGIIYGISAHGLATRLGISRAHAADYITMYFAQYPGIQHYMERTKEQARRHGYVTTLWGRHCYTPLINDSNGMRRAFGERAAINAPLQGGGADIIKKAMIAVDGLLCSKNAQSRLLLQVHDELVIELADTETSLIPEIKRVMEQVVQLDVPLVVDVGTGLHWGDAH